MTWTQGYKARDTCFHGNEHEKSLAVVNVGVQHLCVWSILIFTVGFQGGPVVNALVRAMTQQVVGTNTSALDPSLLFDIDALCVKD